MQKRVLLLFILCLIISLVNVSATSEQEIIDNTLDYMKSNFMFGTQEYQVTSIDYNLIGIEDYEDEVFLYYAINDHDNPEYKTMVGFRIDANKNLITGVLFDDRYLILEKEMK